MYIRLCNLKNHSLFILVKRHNFSTWTFPEPGSWAVTDLGAFSALVLLCWPTSLWITNNRICYSEAETIPTQTTQGICLQINMAFVFYCFLQVLVSWVIHAVQPFCLPECTCSEESFGRCAMLTGFQRVMWGWRRLSLKMIWSDTGLEFVGNQLNPMGFILVGSGVYGAEHFYQKPSLLF